MLELKNVSRSFSGPQGAVCAMRDISLSLNPGDFVAVQGTSGSGKSTLLLVAGGLLGPQNGSVHVRGTDVYKLGQRSRGMLRASAIGFVFQQFHLIPYLSVIDNIMVPALALSGADPQRKAQEIITRFGLEQRAQHVPAKLSVGEQQRAALARAMINKPGIILADEPTGNLDTENATIVMNALAEYTASGGCVLLVTHDDRASAFAKTKYRMTAGVLSAA